MQRYIYFLTHGWTGLVEGPLWMPPVHMGSDKHTKVLPCLDESVSAAVNARHRPFFSLYFDFPPRPLPAHPTHSLSRSFLTHRAVLACGGSYPSHFSFHLSTEPPHTHLIPPHHICQNISLTLAEPTASPKTSHRTDAMRLLGSTIAPNPRMPLQT